MASTEQRSTGVLTEYWSIAERVRRNRAIHAALRDTQPDVLTDLFLLDNICGYCGKEIENIADAEPDHIITVDEFASGPLPLDEVIKQANDFSNLRAVHGPCNWAAGGRITLEKRVGIHDPKCRGVGGRILVEKKLGCHAPGMAAKGGCKSQTTHKEKRLGFYNPATGRRGGLKSVENGTLAKARHTRWHVDRGIVNPQCTHCQQVLIHMEATT